MSAISAGKFLKAMDAVRGKNEEKIVTGSREEVPPLYQADCRLDFRAKDHLYRKVGRHCCAWSSEWNLIKFGVSAWMFWLEAQRQSPNKDWRPGGGAASPVLALVSVAPGGGSRFWREETEEPPELWKKTISYRRDVDRHGASDAQGHVYSGPSLVYDGQYCGPVLRILQEPSSAKRAAKHPGTRLRREGDRICRAIRRHTMDGIARYDAPRPADFGKEN